MPTIKNFCVNGKCSQCGQCCTNLLPMSDSEVNRIHRYMKRHHIEQHFQKTLVEIGSTDLTCPFRDNKNKRCLIYEVRPEICKQFICCEDQNKSFRNRDKILRDNRHTVFCRTEFFGNTEDIDWFTQMQMLVPW